jgi:hypothetical protein
MASLIFGKYCSYGNSIALYSRIMQLLQMSSKMHSKCAESFDRYLYNLTFNQRWEIACIPPPHKGKSFLPS